MLISDTGAVDFGLEHEFPALALAGKRVLMTGISSRDGFHLARTFVDAGARVFLQCNESGPAVQALTELLAPDAAELSVHATPLASSEDIVLFARSAVAAMGGLDMVINIVVLDGAAPAADATLEAIEAQVSEILLKACLVSRVAANRMRLMLTEGVILTVATLSSDATASERAFAQVVRSTLAAMTRREAQAWAEQGIRFNAVAPDVLNVVAENGSSTEADIAQLALYLANGNGTSLSGITLEMSCLAR